MLPNHGLPSSLQAHVFLILRPPPLFRLCPRQDRTRHSRAPAFRPRKTSSWCQSRPREWLHSCVYSHLTRKIWPTSFLKESAVHLPLQTQSQIPMPQRIWLARPSSLRQNLSSSALFGYPQFRRILMVTFCYRVKNMIENDIYYTSGVVSLKSGYLIRID